MFPSIGVYVAYRREIPGTCQYILYVHVYCSVNTSPKRVRSCTIITARRVLYVITTGANVRTVWSSIVNSNGPSVTVQSGAGYYDHLLLMLMHHVRGQM